MTVAFKRHCDKCSAVLPKCFQIVSHSLRVFNKTQIEYNEKARAENMEKGAVELLLNENVSMFIL